MLSNYKHFLLCNAETSKCFYNNNWLIFFITAYAIACDCAMYWLYYGVDSGRYFEDGQQTLEFHRLR